MSIRLIAVELYNIMKEVEALEKQIEKLPPSQQVRRDELREQLRRARAEHERIRSIFEGAKSS
jgi:hypothetical protein